VARDRRAGDSWRAGGAHIAGLCAAAALMAAGACAAEPRLTAAVAADTAHVGDPIALRLTLVAPASSPLALPALAKSLGEFEVLSWTPRKTTEKNGERTASGDAVITAWRTGVLEIPAVRATGDSALDVRSAPIAMAIVSVGLDESGDVRRVRGPVGLPRNWWLIAAVVAGALALGVAALLLVRRLRKQPAEAPAAPAVVRPAHEVAYEELARLASERLVERGLAAEHVIRLADILRDYLGRRFGFAALDMTTSEIIATIRPVFETLPRETRAAFSQAREFLEYGDLVKFADLAPAEAEAASGIARVRAVVDGTREPDAAPLAEAS